MRTAIKTGMLGLLAFCVALSYAPVVRAADAPTEPKAKILVAKTFQTSKLVGLNVRNKQGEKLGTINDLVLNIETGKIVYAALSVGGVLGVGDKLFAVPYDNLAFDHGKNEQFFVLDMPKEKLETAPGFNKSDWPNFADPNWTKKIDDYYTRERTEVRTKNVK